MEPGGCPGTWKAVPGSEKFCFSFRIILFHSPPCLLVFRDRVSLGSPGCPGTHSVDQAGLRDPPASASGMLGLQIYVLIPWFLQCWVFPRPHTWQPGIPIAELKQNRAKQQTGLGWGDFYSPWSHSSAHNMALYNKKTLPVFAVARHVKIET